MWSILKWALPIVAIIVGVGSFLEIRAIPGMQAFTAIGAGILTGLGIAALWDILLN